MTTLEFLLDLRSRGVEVELQGEKLLVRAARDVLPAELAAELRDRKAEIVGFLAAGIGERTAGSAAPPIQRVPRQALMPMSFTQERLWYLSQVETNSAVFNLPLCLEILGDLRTDVLQRALDEIAARHEALRTSVAVRDGIGFQKINPPSGLPMRFVDVAAGSADADRRAALELLDRVAAEPFDLSVDGIRALLVRFAPDRHLLLVVTHHLFFDGASLNVVLDELIALYEAYRSDLPAPGHTAPVDFADYAVWQRSWLQGRALDEQLAFWKESLSGELRPLELPTDHPRPAIRGSRGAKEPLRLSGAATSALFKLAHDEGSTGFIVMLALFNALLHRYSGQEDLLVGVPVANRTRRESQDIVGYVANTLVIRTDCSATPSFRQLVRRVQETCARAFRHQDMPFQKVVEALRPPRDLSRTPIFQVFFAYEEVFSRPPRMADLELNRIVIGSTVARQDMSVFLRRVGDEIHGSVEYSVDLFQPESIQRFIAHLGSLAESASRNPDAPIGTLEFLTDAERLSLAAWNQTAVDVPRVLINEMFVSQMLVDSSRPAIRCGTETLTYAQLDGRANRLARRLRQLGVDRAELVGVCLERSVDLPAALLGVLKRGAAYVPLDPEFPASRLAYMLDNAGIRVIVSQRDLESRLPIGDRKVIWLDDLENDPLFEDAGPCPATPDDRAYVIYTSGSTGLPKGVEVRRSSVVNFLSSMRERPGIRADDVLVAVTTPSFDIAALELFLPLTVGACVVIAPREATMDGARLARLLVESGATMMQATPATWRALLDAGWQGMPRLKALCGGETLPPDLARRLLPCVGELWNMYGPTETTIWSTCTRVTEVSGPIPIGSPIANTVFRVVDRHGQQLPVGVPGELLLGGAGVANGYLGRSELTEQRFVADPTGQEPSMRFYRTGDLVKIRPDGQLEHLGRLDDQVKVQGFRIELGEIESVLGALPAVSEAVVSVQTDSEGDARLVAWVVYRPGEQPTVSEVRRYLRHQLPAYMVPGLIMQLDALPRTNNGKIDRRALPDAVGSAKAAQKYVEPATPMERVVAEAWQPLLSVERIGRTDNFFELGGHSLLSMRAVAAIEKRTGIHLDPRLMFFQTVQQLAATLERQAPAAHS